MYLKIMPSNDEEPKPTEPFNYPRHMARGPTEREVLELLTLGPGTAIPAAEKRGQAALVNSTLLPIDGSNDKAAQESPIKWGPVPLDKPGELFREATLPPGWKKVATDHDMWSHVVDSKGCVRMRVFFKAAFYDMSAHLHMQRRYYAKQDYGDKAYAKADTEATFSLYDNGQGPNEVVIASFTVPLPNCETDRDGHYAALEEARAACKERLAVIFPDAENPNAYWDPA